ncbi:MAG: sigma-54 dependent transcriptional regulator [Syntrophales bacterium]|nr:sigma-54 dependent transcriptional regulator [Syntrophales bacterium]
MDKILIVDDEQNIRIVLEAMLRKEGYDVVTAGDGVEALESLQRGGISAVVTDLRMPKMDGMALLEKAAADYPSVPVIMITAHGTVTTAVEALKKGAFDYVTKPFEQEDLRNVIEKAVKTRALRSADLPAGSDVDWERIVGESGAMVRIGESIRQVAPTMMTVLVTGETGTGKELIAHAIHRNSPRKDNPFIKINCAAIPEHLMESELFGFEKGAFTGAVSKKPGRFELANKGSLFLDEIGEIPRAMQVKLLQVLQDQEFERVGGLRTIKVDVRLIAATNRNLLQDVKEGRFREDLYYRINVFPIHLPPLRERSDDIGALTRYFIDKFNRKLGRNIRNADPEVQAVFAKYAWPGNIREMENIIERMVLVAKRDTITRDDVPPEMISGRHSGSLKDAETAPPSGGGAEAGGADGKPFKDLIKSRTEEVEKKIIVKVLDECDGNVTRAAKQLGVSRKGLQLKMIKYNLRKEPGRGPDEG